MSPVKVDESAKILYKSKKNAVRTSASRGFRVCNDHWMKRRWFSLRPDTADEIYVCLVVGGEAGGLDIKKDKLFPDRQGAPNGLGDGAQGMFFL